jgi:hypothetical protein
MRQRLFANYLIDVGTGQATIWRLHGLAVRHRALLLQFQMLE